MNDNGHARWAFRHIVEHSPERSKMYLRGMSVEALNELSKTVEEFKLLVDQVCIDKELNE